MKKRNRKKMKKFEFIINPNELTARNAEMYRLYTVEEQSLAEIGRTYRLSRERIRQIVFAEKMKKVKKRMTNIMK